MSIELYFDYLFNNPQSMVVGEMTASQLPGRQNGGAADAYRHILLSAELTRDYGIDAAFEVLTDHERDTESGADNGLDMWNNSIGMQIGQYVRDSGGTWEDVVRLARAAMVASFEDGGFGQIGDWRIVNADEGIGAAYRQYLLNLNGASAITFDQFAADFNRSYSFRSSEQPVVLEDGRLILLSAGMTSPENWAVHPKVMISGALVELSVDESAFPNLEWFTGAVFIYEDGNAAQILVFDGSEFIQIKDCFPAGTPVLLADGISKFIEDISSSDLVLSYDASGTLVPGRVTRTFRNEVSHLLDVHGLKVTPGHATLCGEGMFKGRHVPIIDILLSDGGLVQADGTLVRMAINAPVGSVPDAFVKVAVALTPEDMKADTLTEAEMRVGTLLFDREGTPISVLDCLNAEGYAFDPDTGLIAKPGEAPHPLFWFGRLPRPEDYILTRSQETLEGILTDGEWEGSRSELIAGRLRQTRTARVN
jgi:hypothetical protein